MPVSVANGTRKALQFQALQRSYWGPEHMPRGRPRKDAAPAQKKASNGATLGFEAQLFLAADKLRKNLEPSDYKHVALGLIFLRHISVAFEARHAELLEEDALAAEDPDEYLADNIFWVPAEARWSFLQASARQPTIGKLVDEAMKAIEDANANLKGVLPKDYNRPALDKVMLGELIDLISNIVVDAPGEQARDLLGRVYEYFLGGFAGAEGKRGGEFYTAQSVVRVLVEMIEPYKGRVYDPCCGSGGMFVQSEKFVESHGGRVGDIAIYGQESNYTTWRLAKMNLAVRGIDSDIRWNNEGSFHKDELKDLRFDYVLANPPFNVSDWGGERLREDARWTFGTPPVGNANYAWLQHILHHLAPGGRAGVVLSTAALTTKLSAELSIKQRLIEGGYLDCIVELPSQLFYSTPIPVSLWIISRKRADWKRPDQCLFIYARSLGRMTSQTHRELEVDDIKTISSTFRAWSQCSADYVDKLGFCKSATIADIKRHKYTLAPGRYVGFVDELDSTEPTGDRIKRLLAEYQDKKIHVASLETSFSAALGALDIKV
ncbi:class I SAM-dependent DNA methyltransferase [Sphingomonas sp. MJ1 (PH-R8)]|uniref:type I restriction-modification system subunit M n=1 Tax=Sphingomonas sp. MJ1 (PH-R8) TaxID=3112950 RepID=UPI003A893CCF